MSIAFEEIKFDQQGLVPAIIQDARTLRVLMLAYMNRESLSRTLTDGETWFWSRSRASLWHKGETSGHTQRVVDVCMDCDLDAVRVLVVPEGPACHTGAESCFHNQMQTGQEELTSELGKVLSDLRAVIESRRRERPAGSYTTYLFNQGLDKILKKMAEECAETLIAAKNEDRDELVSESSDLLYHLIVLLTERGVSLEEVGKELQRRSRKGAE